jgi:MSHA biogenesis protein MshJ
MKLTLVQNYHQHWKERFEALSLRERILFLLAIIAVLYMGWDMVLMERIRGQQKLAVIQLKKWRQQIADIDARIQVVSGRLSGSGKIESRRRIEELKNQINDFHHQQETLAVGFIRPKQMVDVLKGLLAEEKGLHLTSLESRPAQPLIHPSPPAAVTIEQRLQAHGPSAGRQQVKDQAQASDQTSKQDGDNPALPEVYQHGLEVIFQGNYNSTLSYLKKLEQLPWKFYWEEVTYEVIKYPKAQITVRIHTLSLEKGWIGV